MSILELEALRQALTHWRHRLQTRHGWRVADSAYVRHGAIIQAALLGEN